MCNLLLQDGVLANGIIKYTRNDIIDERNFLKEEIKPNLIILSTNLSGRGIDIKINNELNNKNGLHDILTFLPLSERIERQGFWRASCKRDNRNGYLIIYSQEKYQQLKEKRKKDKENEFNYLIKVYIKKNWFIPGIIWRIYKFFSRNKRKEKNRWSNDFRH